MQTKTTSATTKKKIRVLVVDDSALMRKMVSEILNQQPDIEVIETAKDGEDALQKAQRHRPDVITLDVEMPRMSGLEFLSALMPSQPTPVVMLSSLTTKGAEITFRCLQKGAVDFVGKPSQSSVCLSIKDVSNEIAHKVRMASVAKMPYISAEEPPKTAQAEIKQEPRKSHQDPKMVVVIASSTGGPNALNGFLPYLPQSLDIAYLLVQHLPTGFSRLFANRLNSACSLEVREAEEGESLQSGVVLVAKGGKHLVLDAEGRTAYNSNPPLWGVCPAADMLMPTVAHYYQEKTVGVVLTGMGRDGSLGVKAIHAKGGYCMVQDEASCVVYGMPKSALDTGGVDKVYSITEMATGLIRLYEERVQGAVASTERTLQKAG